MSIHPEDVIAETEKYIDDYLRSNKAYDKNLKCTQKLCETLLYIVRNTGLSDKEDIAKIVCTLMDTPSEREVFQTLAISAEICKLNLPPVI